MPKSHTYTKVGTYSVITKAKDIHGNESDWSAPLQITIFAGWVTIMSEDFEGEFPGTKWTLYGSPTWDKENYRRFQGSWSGWCAGSTRHPSQGYASDMNAWMVYGPFSLTDASDAVVTFYRWCNTEYGHDFLWAGASIDGNLFYRCYQGWGYFNIKVI